jgi:hypothetical protein
MTTESLEGGRRDAGHAARVRTCHGCRRWRGFDLFSQGAPEVTFVRSHGLSDSDSGPRWSIGICRGRSDDLEGSNCAEVLSGAIDDGLEFQALAVFGEDSGRALWFFRKE